MKLPIDKKDVLILSFARFSDALGNGILFIILPLYVAHIPFANPNIPISLRAGFIIAIYGLISSIFQPFSGAISDFLSWRKPLIVIGLIIIGISTLGLSYANRFVDLILIRIFQGIGIALTIPASMALITSSTDKNKRGEAMGIYSSMRLSGFAIGPLLGGLIHTEYGFDEAFLVGAFFVFVSAFLVYFWVDDSSAKISSGKGQIKISDRDVWSLPTLILGSTTFLMAASFSMMTALENEFNLRLQQSALGFGIAFSAYTVSRILIQIPLGRYSDRSGRKLLIICGLLLTGSTTALMGEVVNTNQLIGVRLLQGIATAGISAPSFALVGDLSKIGNEARQISILTMGFGLGVALGPFITGFLAIFAFELPFYVFGLLALPIAWIVYRFVPETVKPKNKFGKPI